jgi:hypothetical protein
MVLDLLRICFLKRKHEMERFRVGDGSRPEGHVPRMLEDLTANRNSSDPVAHLQVGVCLTCERHTH